MDKKSEEKDIADKIFKSRRASVASESYDPDQSLSSSDNSDCLSAHQKAIVQNKSSKQSQILKKILKSLVFFRDFSEEELLQTENCMFEVKVKNQQIIIKEGEEGDTFYIIESGKFEVGKKNLKGSYEPLTTYDGSGYFGELALMYSSPRTATITALSDGLLWGMSRKSFRKLVLSRAAKRRKRFIQFLNSVKIINELSTYEKAKLADALVKREIPANECIIREGEIGTELFFIMEGSVRIMSKTNNNGTKISTLGKGNYFGELALLRKAPRAASVYSITPVTLAVLGIDCFERLLGPCIELMKRSAEASYANK